MRIPFKKLLRGLFVISYFLFQNNPAAGQRDQLISFTLEDQFRREFTDKDFSGTLIVLIASDGQGSEYNPKWGEAISKGIHDKRISERISWIGLADLGNVPFFMKGFVRSFFPDEKENWVLLDWEGQFADVYGFRDGESNILVFDRKGDLVLKTFGKEVKEPELSRIITSIKIHF